MDNVGGYRLVRKLGEGDRAEVWLGHAARQEDRLAAIKLYRETTPDDQIDIELDALTRTESRHVLRLLDVGAAPDGRPCVILPRLGASLARVLGTRESLAAGELVTIGAPLVEAVRELRSAGVVHGAIGPSTVLLDEFGAPVVIGFGYARVIGSRGEEGVARLTPAERDAEPSLFDDLRRLSSMIEHLAVRAADRHGLRPAAIDELIAWLTTRADGELRGDDFLDELGGRLFDLAPAAPIRLDGDTPNFPAAARLIPVSPAPPPSGPGTARLGWLDDRLAEHVDTHPFAALRSRLLDLLSVSRLRAALAPVRPAVWIVGGVGLLSLLFGVLVIPAMGADAEDKQATVVSESRSGSESKPSTQIPGLPPTPHATPSSSSRATSEVSAPPADPTAMAVAVTGDDPIAAAAALIAERARCLGERDAACFDAVDQPVSAALESDRYAVRTKTGAAARGAHPLPSSPVTLVQLLGDSAIIGLGPATATDGAADAPPNTYPASILIVKTTNGWRIRDLTTGVSP